MGESLQQVESWYFDKLGVLSASNAKYILAKKSTDTRKSYIADLVAQVCTGQIPQISTPAMEWGREYEGRAKAAYELKTGHTIKEQPFVYKDEAKRAGCSPDGFIDELNKGVEIKCPYTTKNFIKMAGMGIFNPDYMKQIQFSMWVTDKPTWDLVYYDYRMNAKNLFVQTIERDEKMISDIESSVAECIEQIDQALESLGFKFGDQWKREAA